MGEAFITRRGGTGSGLVLRIVGGTTQPAAPKDNTIWVNTDTAITSYALQHDAPADPAAGMVWIQTSYFSFAEMDVDKKNDVKVYPIAAFQYINGAWVDKQAKSYINGQWKDWVVTVYNGEADFSKWGQGTSLTSTAFTYTEDGFLRMAKTNSQNAFHAVYTEPFDLTNVASVRYYGYSSNESSVAGGRVLGVRLTERGSNVVTGDFGADWTSRDPLEYRDLDVSTLSGEHYIFIGSTRTVYIKRIVLIPIGGNI